ncbi:hypothetical protein MP228_000244 [Amoeboaphelidium protococcarum]|nr:hypothetical protein MP228_000244 [Amoeboaphelidium protococcarum]
MPPKEVRINKAANDRLALTNCLIVSKSDYPPTSNIKYVALKGGDYVFTILADDTCAPGEVGTSSFHRRWANLSLGEVVSVTPYDPSADGSQAYLASMSIEIGFLRKTLDIKDEFDTNEMSKVFIGNYGNQVFTKGQQMAFEFCGVNLAATIQSVGCVDIDALKRGKMESSAQQSAASNGIGSNRGVLMHQTQITFVKDKESSIRLKGGKSVGSAIINPDFKFEDMGIGGLDQEFSGIFRRAFASRIFPPALVQKLGIQHVRGILLYGPPGTGKTLMARQIGKMLNAKEPKIVNGPEILNKYVGASEENIRKLFAEAESEYKTRGDNSDLHIIIFDEIDAICKQRGSKNDGTGVGDSIVNQLLSKMDGVDQLNNILVIGMTNRLDMIDEALLRPGRLEVHMEVNLPDEKGRTQIMKIHTAKMRQNNILDDDVDVVELAQLTKNYSGAEIAGLVKSASSFAFNRHIKVGSLANVDKSDIESLRICRDDFMHALDEVKPAFGVSEAEMKACVMNGIIHFNDSINKILTDGQLYVQQVKKSARTPLVSVLIKGPSGCGKTALAATIAMASEFPYIKLISADNMVGYTENSKMTAITKIFTDSYKSPMSVIVVDSIERLLDYVPIGPRFSNGVLQTLVVLLKKQPPKDRKLLIIATTSQPGLLEQMDMADCFNAELKVASINNIKEVLHVVKDLQLFSDAEYQQAVQRLQSYNLDGQIYIGIKKLLMIIEMARQDVDKVEKFISALQEECSRQIVPDSKFRL